MSNIDTEADAPAKKRGRKPGKKAAGKKAAGKKAAAPAKKAPGGTGRKNAFDDAQSLTVKANAEHTRRETSRYGRHYELMRKVKTVGEYRKKGGEQDALRDAVKEGYAKIGKAA